MDNRLMKAKSWHATCLACGKDFNYADGFQCDSQPGLHTVEDKEYFHLGAGHIQSLRDRRLFAPMLNLRADIEVRDKVTGQISRLEGIIVTFNPGGRYTTSNPAEQYYLDMHPHVRWGTTGIDAWEKMYLTPEQQLHKAQSQLADVQKQIRDSNALLDLTKQRKVENGVGVR